MLYPQPRARSSLSRMACSTRPIGDSVKRMSAAKVSSTITVVTMKKVSGSRSPLSSSVVKPSSSVDTGMPASPSSPPVTEFHCSAMKKPSWAKASVSIEK